MAQNKVNIIRDWPEPQKVKDIQSFLGFANFYHRFIYNYSDIVVPLMHLTQKDAPWNFFADCRHLFNSLKEAFTSVPILTHYQPDTPIIVETNTSDYVIAGILSNICPDGEIRPVAFYLRMLTVPELNYDTHDKELLAIFEAFCSWRHYLKGSASPVDIVTDHKNLIYFSTSKVLMRRQARWSEYLSQFNLVIRFRLSKLGAKPDVLTRPWDVYPKEGDKGFACVNPQNLPPVFTTEQLNASLRATHLQFPILRASAHMDIKQLHNDILSALPSDPIAQIHLSDTLHLHWSIDATGLLRLDGCIFVPEADDLRLRILCFKHDHSLLGHYGQSRTLNLVQCEYTWPGVHTYVKDYVKSCTAYAHAKTPRHRPYGMLKQLPIPE